MTLNLKIQNINNKAMATKTFFGRLLADIAEFFEGLFTHVLSGAKKDFKDLPQEVKDALIHGSGIMDLIRRMTDNTPAEIRAAIQEEFPDLDIAKLEEGLFRIAHAFNLAPKVNDLDDCIKLLQTYLSTLQGEVWDVIMHTAASILGIILAPPGQKVGGLVSLMEYVYQTFFKKK